MIPSRVCRFAGIALALWLGCSTTVACQITGGGRIDEGARIPDAEDPALATHMNYLVKCLAHKNKIIRRSAHQGLVAIGKPAIGVLESAVKVGPDGKVASNDPATRILKTIRKRMEARAARGADAAPGDARRPKRRQARLGIDEARLRKVAEGVGIDASLVVEIKAFMEEHRKALQEVKKNPDNLDRIALAEKRKALSRAYREKLQDLLGAEKAQAFLKALARDRKSRIDARKPGDRKKRGRRADGTDI